MLRLAFIFIISLCLSSFAFANKVTRVIYITFDGTRWQDVYVDRSHFPKLWGKYGNELTFYGMPNSRTAMYVATVPTSLPSYQTQTSGFIQPCFDNDCGRIRAQTFLENILLKNGFNKKDVVTFASWHGISDAAESVFDITYTNICNVPAVDPITHIADPVMAQINSQQSVDGAQDGDRYDKYTFAQAIHYLEKYEPRFMWIQLNDSDARAHAGDLEGYHKMLETFDTMLDQLFTKLKALNLDDQTMVIVTTDHGRGDGANWTEHGIRYPESVFTFAFVRNGKLKYDFYDGYRYYYSTLSIRPTIESAFGIG